MTEPHILHGVTIPLVTAMDNSGRPDAAGSQRLLEAMAAAEVDSLMLLGSNGEGGLLTPDLTTDYLVEVIARWRQLRPAGRAIVNVSDAGTTGLLRRAERALGAAPDALVVSPPSAYRHRPDEIERHLRAVERFGLPYAIYNVPRYTTALPLEVFRSLLDSPALIGVKDSSGDPEVLAQLVATASERPGVAVCQGDERALLAGLQQGAIGIVPGIGNIAPALSVALVRHWRAGRLDAARAAQDVLTALTGVHAVRPGVPTVKAILRARGLLESERCAEPLIAVTPSELDAVLSLVAPHDAELVGRG